MVPYLAPGPLHLGPLSFQPWGTMVALGFLAGSLLSRRLARQRGLDPEPFWTILLWLVPGTIVFGHLGDVVYRPAYYRANPVALLRVWDGLSSYAGFFGCAALAVFFARRRRLDVLKSCDLLAVGVTLGWMIGRLGCFLAHDHIGRPVSETAALVQTLLGWLAVPFPDGTAGRGVPAAVRFDLGLLESVASGAILAVLLALARRPRRPGTLVGAAAILYAVTRFALDFLRNVDLADAEVRYLGLTPAQYGSFIALALGAFALHHGRGRPPWPEEEVNAASRRSPRERPAGPPPRESRSRRRSRRPSG